MNFSHRNRTGFCYSGKALCVCISRRPGRPRHLGMYTYAVEPLGGISMLNIPKHRFQDKREGSNFPWYAEGGRKTHALSYADLAGGAE
jgi:hypothetical protein